MGLHSMRERAHLLGGTFDIESGPGKGVIIRVAIPLNESYAIAPLLEQVSHVK